MDKTELIEKGRVFWSRHLKVCAGSPHLSHPELLADFAAEQLGSLTAEVEQLRAVLTGIRDMPDYDQDNEHRLRNIARQALNPEE